MSNQFALFWFAYAVIALALLIFNQTVIFTALTIALVLTTPLRHRWL